jgi:hypothetical protein
MHVYVPAHPRLSLVVVDVPCPHCGRWAAEILRPAARQSIVVRACQRTELAWGWRRVMRRLRTLRAHARIAINWPYWALYRLRSRARRRARVGSRT